MPSPEPPDIEHFNPDGRAPVLLLCDHAGKRIPERLRGLGISGEMLSRHIGWDIGAADMTRRLATLLDAPAILCHVSRLVIDPNRRPATPSSIPDVSDGCVIPGNEDLPSAEALRRVREHWLGYHRAVARRIGAFRGAGTVPAIVAMHSFTPHMSGEDRPWQIGVLWRGDQRLSAPVLQALRRRGDLVVGDNQPYSGLADFGFTVTFHAQRPRLPHVMFEVRQDEIDTTARAVAYANLIHGTLEHPLADPGLYRLYDGHNLAGTGRPMAWREASVIPPRP
ncbi:MAG TPA: N-formylglutamate amidohydrolase [Geminicoccaceae bacterium]|nr:N-formylglutamate amidohydrolase [Geminicoccus sp.]HMU49397.1 N-formylglutamate amidohydrolase [Geminicoccaceae bacterium]